MAVEYYLITQTSDEWWTLRHDGLSLATFPEKKQAIRAAVAMANAIGSQGQETTVTGVDADGLTYPIWTYGKDAFTTVE